MNGHRATVCVALLVLPLALAATGCGRQTAGQGGPPLYKVKGTIKLNGKELEGAEVTFHSKDGSYSSFGRTGPDGRYTLTTHDADDGAPAGDYIVTVAKYQPPPAANVLPQTDPNYNPYTGRDGPTAAPPRLLVPEKFSNRSTSTLEAKVEPTDANTFDFELK